jgi:sarcosine oxidase subunit beta
MSSLHDQISSDLPATADLVVIGGGIVGVATAFFAARAGLRTVVVEKRPLIAGHTTMNATGAFRAQFDNPEEMALVREGIALFEQFAEATELRDWDIGLRQQGYLWLATTPATVERQRELVRQQRAWGLDDVEWLTGDEARQRFPYLGPEVIGARYRPADGWLDVRKLALGYVLASRATFVLNAAVTGFDLAGGSVRGVQTTRGAISTDRAVIAAGPFSGVVAQMAGLDLPISLVRRQRVLLLDVPELPPDAPMTIDEETGAHWRPAAQGAHLMWTQAGEPPSPPQEDMPTSADFAFSLLDPASPAAVARISPFWRAVWERGTSHWYLRAGQYTYTPDHRPLLGPTPIAGLYLNAGYSGHGIMGSAGGSRLTIETITGSLAPEQNPFRLDRPMIPRALDML